MGDVIEQRPGLERVTEFRSAIAEWLSGGSNDRSMFLARGNVSNTSSALTCAIDRWPPSSAVASKKVRNWHCRFLPPTFDFHPLMNEAADGGQVGGMAVRQATSSRLNSICMMPMFKFPSVAVGTVRCGPVRADVHPVSLADLS